MHIPFLTCTEAAAQAHFLSRRDTRIQRYLMHGLSFANGVWQQGEAVAPGSSVAVAAVAAAADNAGAGAAAVDIAAAAAAVEQHRMVQEGKLAPCQQRGHSPCLCWAEGPAQYRKTVKRL